jgi:hypothetical protein
LENPLHAENVAQKKINSDEHFARSFSFMAVKGKLPTKTKEVTPTTSPALKKSQFHT